MIRLSMALLLLAAACGEAHLGAGHGDRTRAAFAAQAEGRSSEAPADFDADDARRVLAKHRGKKDAAAPTTSGGAAVVMPMPTLGSPTTPAAGGVNTNPIRLEAK